LKLVARQDVPLRLIRGRFCLNREALPEARDHFISWYGEHAKAWLLGCVNENRHRMHVKPAGVNVQDLGYRWGSCGKGDRLYFHWKSILLPPRIAEYVVVHEMAHLHERHHTPAFWRRVERAMPDYEQRKAWLAEHGMEVEGV
jgi:predicted metal-dependent hydrolase